MGSRLSKRRWRWLEYLFTMWLQFSQWRENLWDGFFLRNHQSCTGVEHPSHAFPQRFVSFSYTRDLFIWSLAQLLSYVFLHTHPKSDSDVCTYNQSPLCLSVVIATKYKPSISIQRYVCSIFKCEWMNYNCDVTKTTKCRRLLDSKRSLPCRNLQRHLCYLLEDNRKPQQLVYNYLDEQVTNLISVQALSLSFARSARSASR